MTRIPIVHVPALADQKKLFWRLYNSGCRFGTKTDVMEGWEIWVTARSGSDEKSLSPYIYIENGILINGASFASTTIAKIGLAEYTLWHRWLRLNSADQLIRYLESCKS